MTALVLAACAEAEAGWTVGGEVAIRDGVYGRCLEVIGRSRANDPLQNLAICNDPITDATTCWEGGAVWVQVRWNQDCEGALEEILRGPDDGEEGSAPSPPPLEPPAEVVPAEIERAARVVSTKRDGPTVPWSARLQGSFRDSPVCRVGFLPDEPELVVFVAVLESRGAWTQLVVAPDLEVVFPERYDFGTYWERFDYELWDYLGADGWSCRFVESNAYPDVVIGVE